MQQEHDGPAARPGLAVEDVDAADGGEVTSAGTTRAAPSGASFAVSVSSSERRPASATCQPASSRLLAMTRPSPELAPVTTATLML